jgi:uncharacterized protein (DUF1778 family)
MPTRVNVNNTNLNIRISHKVKELLDRRAESLGISSSEYVRMLILEDARHMLDEDAARDKSADSDT